MSVRRVRVAALLCAVVLNALHGSAGTLIWNGGGGTSGPVDGLGAWDTTTLNWWDSTLGSPATWSDGSDAAFGAGTGNGGAATVSISGIVAPGRITFSVTGDGAPYSLTGGFINLNNATTSFTANVNASIESLVAGSGGIAKAGNGTLTLSGANTFTGGTVITAGALQLNSAQAIQQSTVTVNVDNGLAFGSGIGTFNVGGLSGGSALALTDTAGQPAALSAGGNNASTTYNGVLSGSGAVTKVGTGTLTLANANAFSGRTTVDSGVLQLGAANAVQKSTVLLSVDDGLAFGSGIGTFNVGGLSGGGALKLADTASQPVTFSVGGNNASTTYNGVLSGSGAVTKVGTGTLTLTNASAYDGVTTIRAGALNVQNGGALGATAGGTVVAVNGASLQLQGGIIVTDEPLTITGDGGGGALRNISGDNTWTGTITLTPGAQSRIMSDAGMLTLSGNILGSTSTTVIDTLVFGGGGAGTISGVISGTINLRKSGTTGLNWVLSGANTFTGTTTVSAATPLGAVQLGHANALQYSTYVGGANNGLLFSPGTGTFTLGGLNTGNSLTLADTGGAPITLQVGNNNANTTFSGALDGPGSLAKIGAGKLSLTGVNNHTGGTTIASGTLSINADAALGAVPASPTTSVTFTGNSTLQAAGALNLASTRNLVFNSGATITVDSNNNPVTVAGVIGGEGSLTKTGLGALTLAGANTFSGVTAISVPAGGNGGTLELASSDALRRSTYAGGANNALKFLPGIGTFTLGGLSGANSLALSDTGAPPAAITLRVGNNSTDTTYSAVLSGPGSLVKVGDGVLTLSGVSTYTGPTAVDTGTLNLSGGAVITATSALAANRGGTLKIDNSATNLADRLPSAATVTLSGGTLAYLGNNGAVSSETLGQLVLGSGVSTVAISRGTNAAYNARLYFGSGDDLRSVLSRTSGSGGMLNFTASVPGQGGPGGPAGSTNPNGGGDQVYFGAAASMRTPAAWLIVNGRDIARYSSGQGIQELASNGGVVRPHDLGAAAPGSNVLIDGSVPQTAVAGKTINSLVVQSTSAQVSNLTGTLNLCNSGTGQAFLDRNGGIVVSGGGDYTISGGTLTSGVSGTRSELFTWIDSGTTTINSVIADVGGGASTMLIKAGAGTLALAGANTFTDSTIVNMGALRLDTANTLQQTHFAAWSGSALQFAPGVGTFHLGGLEGAGGVVLADTAAAPVTLTLGANNANSVFSGAIRGPGSLVKVGTGTLTLSGNSTYAGPTTISGGTLVVMAAESFGDGDITISAATLEAAGNATSTGDLILNDPAAAIRVAPGVTFANSGTIATTGAAGLRKIGGGALDLTGAVTDYSGPTKVSAGTLSVGRLPNTASVTVDGGVLNAVTYNPAASLTVSFGGEANISGADLSISAPIVNNGEVRFTPSSGTVSVAGLSGGGTLAKVGAGTLALTSASTYSGPTLVNAGILNIQNAAALGTTAGGTSVADAACLQLQGGITVTGEPLALAGTGLNGDNYGALRSVNNSNNVWTGDIAILGAGSAAGRFGADVGSTLTIHGRILGTNNWTDQVSIAGGGTGTIDAVISGHSSLRKATTDGGSTWILAAANTFDGDTVVGSPTTGTNVLQLNHSNALQNSTYTGGADNGLAFAPGIGAFTLGGLATGSALALADTGGAAITLRVGNNNGATVSSGGAAYNGVNSSSGALTGPGSLVKIGTGTQVLAGANTYAGYTTVEAGTLSVAGGGVIVSPAITVNPGATMLLDNSGTNGANTRVGDSVPVTLNGGRFSLLGNNGVASTETAGKLVLGPGVSTVTISRGTNAGFNARLYFGSGTDWANLVSRAAGSGSAVNFTATIPGQGGPGGDYVATAHGGGDNVLFGNVATSINTPAAWMVVNGRDFARYSASRGIHEIGTQVHADRPRNLGAATGTTNVDVLIDGTVAQTDVTTSKTINSLVVQSRMDQTSTLASGVTLNLSNSGDGGSPLDRNGGICVSGGYNSATGGNHTAGDYTINGGTLTSGASGTNSELLTWIDSGTTTINSVIANIGGGAGAITLLAKSGAGTLALGGANTFTGNAIVNGGAIMLATATTLQRNTYVGYVDNGLRFAPLVGNFALGGLSGAGGITLDDPVASPVTLQVGANNASTTYSGVLSGGGSLRKVGSGTLTLTGSSTYAGGTTITSGTVRVENTVGSATGLGTLTINGPTAILRGNGTVASPVVVQVGRLAPGLPGSIPGTLSIHGDLNLTANSVLDYRFAATGNDMTAVSGSLAFPGSGSAGLNLTDLGGLVLGGAYNLFSYGSLAVTPFRTDSILVNPSTIPPALADQMFSFDTYASGGVNYVRMTIGQPGPVSGQWTGGGSDSNWSTGGNWQNGRAPSKAPDTAKFGGLAATAGTVTLDSARTISSIEFDNAAKYTLAKAAGANPPALTLDMEAAGTGTVPVLVTSGKHDVAAPLLLGAGVQFTITHAADQLTVSGGMANGANGAKGIIKDGPGRLVLSGIDTYTGGTRVLAGELDITQVGALPAGGSLTIGAGGTVVLASGLHAQAAASGASAASPVPEPGTLALLIAGAVVCVGLWLRRRSK